MKISKVLRQRPAALPLVLRFAVPVSLALASMGAHAAEPEFDCSHASGQVEQLVCKNRELSRLDQELNRVFNAANQSPAAKHHPELKAMQRGWIKGRNDCWKNTDMATCVRDSYVLRIVELKQDFPAMADGMSSGMSGGMAGGMSGGMAGGTSGGKADGMSGGMAANMADSGITIGPLALSCSGIKGKVSVTFVNSEPGAAALTIGNQTRVLGHTTSASGARYAATLRDGEYMLWNKGREYRLELPGQPATLCDERARGQ